MFGAALFKSTHSSSSSALLTSLLRRGTTAVGKQSQHSFGVGNLPTPTRVTRFRRTMSSSTHDDSHFVAWRVEEMSDGSFVGSDTICSIDSLKSSRLKEDTESTLIKVTHSSLNYKDALSAAGTKGVTRTYPHTPGIDASGIDVESGNAVLATGYDMGMNTDGGFGERIKVPAEWVLAPNPFLAVTNGDVHKAGRLSMVYGTAGLTAAVSVSKLLEAGKATPDDGSVVVTGATGGVGSISVEILARLGFSVVAVSGKAGDESAKNRLLELGATQVVGREALAVSPKPLLRPEYAHGIDTVGGAPLAELLKRIAPEGSLAACGNAAGVRLETTVFPFILRGVRLLGVDTAEISTEERKRLWHKLAHEWRCPATEAHAKEIGRHELGGCLGAMLKGESSGRVLLDHSKTDEGRSEGQPRSKL